VRARRAGTASVHDHDGTVNLWGVGGSVSAGPVWGLLCGSSVLKCGAWACHCDLPPVCLRSVALQRQVVHTEHSSNASREQEGCAVRACACWLRAVLKACGCE
jgi:hypothetical protein